MNANPLRIIWLIALLYVVLSILFITPIVPEQTEYEYNVKMEQAYAVDRVEDSDVTEFSEFSEDEQDVLYKAFKEVETGQMFGETSAEVSVTFDEQRDVFDTWRTVEVNGIVLLVAVQENAHSMWDTSIIWVDWWAAIFIGSMLYVLSGALWWVTGRPHTDQRRSKDLI